MSNFQFKDEEFVSFAMKANFSQSQWKAMFYDVGPYDITNPTHALERYTELVRADLIYRITAATKVLADNKLHGSKRRSYAHQLLTISITDVNSFIELHPEYKP